MHVESVLAAAAAHHPTAPKATASRATPKAAHPAAKSTTALKLRNLHGAFDALNGFEESFDSLVSSIGVRDDNRIPHGRRDAIPADRFEADVSAG